MYLFFFLIMLFYYSCLHMQHLHIKASVKSKDEKKSINFVFSILPKANSLILFHPFEYGHARKVRPQETINVTYLWQKEKKMWMYFPFLYVIRILKDITKADFPIKQYAWRQGKYFFFYCYLKYALINLAKTYQNT